MAPLENAFGKHRDQFTKQDRFDSIAASAVMGVSDNVLHVTGFAGAVTVTLPHVAQAAGQFYAIKILDDSSVNAITISDQGDSRSWTDLSNSDAAGGSVLLFSDGEQWFVVAATNVS